MTTHELITALAKSGTGQPKIVDFQVWADAHNPDDIAGMLEVIDDRNVDTGQKAREILRTARVDLGGLKPYEDLEEVLAETKASLQRAVRDRDEWKLAVQQLTEKLEQAQASVEVELTDSDEVQKIIDDAAAAAESAAKVEAELKAAGEANAAITAERDAARKEAEAASAERDKLKAELDAVHGATDGSVPRVYLAVTSDENGFTTTINGDQVLDDDGNAMRFDTPTEAYEHAGFRVSENAADLATAAEATETDSD